jgi:hypothetical protein
MSNAVIEYISNIWYVGDWMKHRYDSYNPYMKKFEAELKQNYPLGEESFTIDHGENYFMFFRRLGEPFYYAIFDEDRVVGTVCYVYRKIAGDYVMYMCDLKFNKTVRGHGLMTKMLYRTIPNCLLRTLKFYAISMNDSEIAVNRIFSMGNNLGDRYNIKIENGGVLAIYSLNYDQMCFVHDLVIMMKSHSTGITKNLLDTHL